ncbi:membrane protein [Paenibacillus agaridevorans]|uniref:Membrane protein n=1 Tax=Paenibacillus agaridevorans TaxID=171404 RepID=A0A2R5EZT7_9BACL|nr:MBL fold metallo-hydrolase [Paenibacillus agaridevorans]GBG11625.1 membrane protein [Paenibacillus agaridevorans]
MWLTLAIIILIVLVIVVAVPLVQIVVPVFGSRPSREELGRYASLPHYDNGKFRYPLESKVLMSFKEMLPAAWEFIRGNPDRNPREALPYVALGEEDLRLSRQPRVIWFGHSAALLQMDGLTILFDPMFGKAPSPFPIVGGKRYGGKLPMQLEALPRIDYVFISHDHYDHLDYPSIKRLEAKVGHFFVPLGVGAHLQRWGVSRNRITEMDWWEEREVGSLKLACAPARHFSGRGTTTRDSTLWCSWALRGREGNIFFCGDSGYGPHFQEIGERLGPFDLTLMECGQYDEKWAAIHMLPEQTVQAHLDVRGGLLLPIHWGGFTLAMHSWDDPAIRVTKEAERRGVTITTPMIGESIPLRTEGGYPNRKWWEA